MDSLGLPEERKSFLKWHIICHKGTLEPIPELLAPDTGGRDGNFLNDVTKFRAVELESESVESGTFEDFKSLIQKLRQ